MSRKLKKITGLGLAIVLPLFAVWLFSSVYTGISQVSRSADLAYAACGDGVLDGADVCDDGNLTDGDGCSATCETEAGYTCDETPSVCLNYAPRTGVYVAICGNGIVEGNLEGVEQCDDGKQCVNGDTCTDDSDCLIGDNLCKTRANDGCSVTCQIESSSGSYTPLPVENVFISRITARPEQRFGSNNYDTTFHFKVLDPDNQNHQVIYSHPILLNLDNSGVDNSSTQLFSVTEGNYDISLKTKSHLALILDNVHLYPGENFLNFTNETSSPIIGSVVLKAGDINGLATSSSNLGDNVVNSVDISILLSKMNNPDPTGNTIRANLNQDTLVDQTDLTILLGNLDKEGDK